MNDNAKLPDLRKPLADAVARTITSILIEGELNEAEAVYALIVGATMRLAADCETLDELKLKLERAKTLFGDYLPANLEAFQRAINAKNQAEAKAEEH